MSLSQKINSEIDRVKNLQESLNDKQKQQNNSLTDEDQKRLSDCQSKLSALQTVSKLAEFADQLDTNKNASNNILNNLCTGLEKFLGFDSASKGYDGTGIVYSDLDRLCDAVMGFLHHVLKDVSEKQPYSVGKEKLNEAVTELKKNLSTGRDGFKVIAQVARKVGEYNESVKQSNDDIKSVVAKMQNHVGNELKNKLNAIDENNLTQDSDLSNAVRNAADLVKDCASKCDEFNDSLRVRIAKDSGDGGSRLKYVNGRPAGRAVKYEDREELKDLNSDLRAKINNARDNVLHEANRLTTLSAKQKDYLDEMIELIKRTCRSLNRCVTDQIGEKVNKLVSELAKKIEEIKKSLQAVENKLWQFVKDLATWIFQADGIVIAGINKANGIEKKDVGSVNKDNIDKVIEEIKKAFDAADGYVKQLVGNALKAVGTMDEELKKDLYKVKTQIKEGIRSVITRVAGEVSSEIDKEGKAAVAAFKKKMEEIHKNISMIRGKEIADLKNAVDVQLSQPAQAAQEKIGTVLGEYSNKIVDTIKTLNSNVLNLTVQFIKAQANELEKRIERQLESLPDKIKKINGNGVEGFKRRIQDLIRSIHHDQTQQNIEGYQRQLDDIRNAVLQALNNANESWRTDIYSSLQGIGNDVRKFNQTPSQALQDSAAQRTLHTLCRRLDELRTLAKCVGDEQWHRFKLKWPSSTNVLNVNQQIEQMHGDVIDWICGKPSNLQETVRNAQGICNALSTEIHKQNPQSPFSNVSQTISNQNSMIDNLLNQFEQRIRKHVDKLSPEVGVNRNGIKSQLETLQQNITVLKSAVNGVDSNATTVESALSAWISKAGRQLQEAQDTADQATTKLAEEMKTQIDAAIATINRKVQEHIGTEQEGTINKLGNNTFEQYKKQIAQKPESLSALASGNLENLKGNEGTLPTAIKSIGDFGLQLFKTKLEVNGQNIREEIGFLKQITDNLTLLIEAFSKAGKAVNAEFKKLQTQIGRKEHGSTVEVTQGSLQKIYDNLSSVLRDDVDPVIKSTTKLVKLEADKLKQHCTESLKQYVNTKSQNAEGKLITHAREQYVSSIKQYLQQFSGKVSAELSPLPTLIDTDRQHGFKGFMRTLQGRIEGDGGTNNDNIQKLKTVADTMGEPDFDKKGTFQKLSSAFADFYLPLNKYLLEETTRINDAENNKKNPVGTDKQPYGRRLFEIYDSLNELTTHFKQRHRYDCMVPGMLDKLGAAIDVLKPNGFSQPSTPVIDCVSSGFTNFVGVLRNVYISTYDRQTFEGELIHDTGIDVAYSNKVYRIKELTEYGRRCAKVCLTVTPILYGALTELKDLIDGSHGKWNSYTIYNKLQSNHSLHRLFFNENGYDVGRAGNTEHGELNHRKDFNGSSILQLWSSLSNKLFAAGESVNAASTSPNTGGLTLEVVTDEGLLEELYSYLHLFFKVRHLTHIDKPRAPCNIYEMLLWACGLQFNSVYGKLVGYCDSLFAKQKDKQDPDREIPLPVVAYPNSITPDRIISAVKHITSHAYLVLTGILGTGDALTVYACDFPTNVLGLQYPTSGADCYHYLLDILRRVLPVFSFLQSQCGYPASDMGWSQCLYGKAIDPSSWQCTDHPKNKPKCEPKCESKCRPTSPLMSYLSDCLASYLPHKLESVGCKSECKSCPSSQPGLPCLTPLGFKAFSGSTHRGKDLYDIISEFLDNLHISALFCLAPRPPSNIAEHFAFSLCLVKGWHHSSQLTTKGVEALTFQNKFKSSIRDLSINLQDNPEELTDALTDAYGSESANHKACEQDHVSSLTSWDACSKMKDNCSPYLASLSSDSYVYIANKHTSAYLSWATYLPWQFWNYLNSLLDAFSNIACNEFGCRSCMHGDTCSPGKHGMLDTSCNCPSMVRCKGVSPTLYRYGLRFATGWELNDEQSRKTCFDFRTQLNKVLNSDYFTKLFRECDNFLFTIRAPFIWTTVALWLLSFLYLLHIMVIRLDLLHIKSHLHSPSSHRIAAQSLLAAGRVNKLNRVFYLQP